MAITDLTGTKWYFNEVLQECDPDVWLSWNLMFTYFNGEEYNQYNHLQRTYGNLTYILDGGSSASVYYDQDGASLWFDEAYRTIEITGGTDATNTTLITWLQNNATQITLPIRSISLENLNTFKEELELEISSMALPTTTVAGKVLKSTTTAGTIQWGDDANTTYTFAEGTTNKAFKVTPSGGTAQTVYIHGLGDASLKGVTTSVTSGSSSLVTSGGVYTYVNAKSTTIEIVDLTNA